MTRLSNSQHILTKFVDHDYTFNINVATILKILPMKTEMKSSYCKPVSLLIYSCHVFHLVFCVSDFPAGRPSSIVLMCCLLLLSTRCSDVLQKRIDTLDRRCSGLLILVGVSSRFMDQQYILSKMSLIRTIHKVRFCVVN